MKILLDMNLSPRWVSLLADHGIQAAHWSMLGAKNAPDSEIMAYARAENYIVLTHDLDFGAILAATQGENPVSFKSAPTMSARTLSVSRLSRCYGKCLQNWKMVPC